MKRFCLRPSAGLADLMKLAAMVMIGAQTQPRRPMAIITIQQSSGRSADQRRLLMPRITAAFYRQCRKACGIGDARKPMDKDLWP